MGNKITLGRMPTTIDGLLTTFGWLAPVGNPPLDPSASGNYAPFAAESQVRLHFMRRFSCKTPRNRSVKL
ncbi:MAG: hypothetical protein LBF86_09625 [Helicobacteraceae bacterium]|nr:hypothetical protein [Helicobacteraceae bacterium]